MVGRVSCCRGTWYCCVCTRRLDSGSHVSIVLRVDRSSALGFGLSRTGAPAVGKHGAVSRKGRVCGALACANDFDLLLLGAASVEVFFAVDGGSGLPEFLLIQASAASLGVTETFRDPRAAGIAVVATWADFAILFCMLALRASVGVPVIV